MSIFYNLNTQSGRLTFDKNMRFTFHETFKAAPEDWLAMSSKERKEYFNEIIETALEHIETNDYQEAKARLQTIIEQDWRDFVSHYQDAA